MNYKRSLPVAAVIAALLVEPVAALAQPGPALSPAPQLSAPAPAAPVAEPRVRTIREGVVAVVNDDPISTYQLRQEIYWLALTNGLQVTNETLPQLQNEALDALIDERLKAQELRRQASLREMKPDELMVTDEDVEEYLTQLAAQNQMPKDAFLAQLARSNISAKSLRQRLKIEMSWEDFARNFYGRRARVTQDQLDAVEARIAANAAAPSYQISEIFIDAERAGGQAAAVAIANQRLQAIQQGAQFAAQARQYSARPTAANGGDAGWVTPGELDPAVAAALAEMRPGQITRPIPVNGGAYLIFLRERRAGGGEPVVSLKQAAINVAADAPADQVQAAQTALLAIKAKNPTCANLEAAAAGVAGVEVGDLGEAEVKDLTASFRAAIENLQPGQISNPVRTNIGLHLVAVCARRTSGQDLPSRQELGDRLMAQQVDMLQRRELRDLRAAATISQPQ
jgi:peptidyl-prolyl cis-trans isomerase SurA